MLSDQYLPRTLEPVIEKASNTFKIVMLSGLRQSGKSTLLQHLSDSSRQYVTLDNAAKRINALEAPEEFFRSNPAPATIDEIQLAPDLFRAMKEAVDADSKTGQYWISGSQRLSLMSNVSEKLPGRLVSFDLWPMSIYERFGKGLEQKPYRPDKEPGNLKEKNKEDIWPIIFQGAWPRVLDADEQARSWFFDSLMDLYISRDIAALTGVDKTLEFQKFLQAIAIRSGQELKLQTLAQMCSVSIPTIRRWLSIAEASGIIFLLKPFSSNINKQIVKSPKLYMADTGLMAACLHIESVEELKRHPNSGSFFETFVVTEILKSWCHNGRRADFYFYRDSAGMEIDLLIHSKGLYFPVEIKAKSSPDSHDAKWIKKFKDMKIPTGQASIISMTPERYYVAPEVVVHSVWEL